MRRGFAVVSIPSTDVTTAVRRSIASLVAACLLAAVVGCSDPADTGAVVATTAPPVSTTVADATTSPTTSEPDPAYRSWIANVRPERTAVTVHESPGGPQLQLDLTGKGGLLPVGITNPLKSGAPTTFLVKQRDVEGAGARWHEVYLPVRPNGATGWIADDDVVLTNTDMSARIDLTTHTLELSDAGAVIATYPVAAGEPETPTPTGSFYVKELVEPPKANGTYGPLAYGLSAFSPTLVDTEAFADGVIGIHGTNRPDLIGTDVSHGCVRVRNEDVLDLERRQVPLGMPVTIVRS